jgi:Ni/Co efflux regulator RcnB
LAAVEVQRHFEDRHRAAVRDYYVTEYRSGHCPPGLAKKNNGCMPPGQAKKWSVGQTLGRDIVYYEVPSALVIRIGTPPPGYRYVRVAADILLIAVGTGMVIDAIADLGSM